MAASSSVTDDHVSEVFSWIHDEGRCVTTQSVAWTFGLSRTQASEVLTKCVGEKKAYQVITMQPKETEEDGVTQTVFGLSKSAISSADDLAVLTGAVYAISLDSTTEQLPTAHQKDLHLLREQLSNFQHAVIFDHAAADIEATVAMERRDAQASQQARWNQMGQVATDRRGVSAAVATTSKARTTTTATSFFGDKDKVVKAEPTKSSTSSSTTNKVSKKADKAPDVETAAPPPKKTSFFGNSASTSSSKATTKQTSTTKQMAPPVPEEKENTPNVGTADDFMGDEDEDDDFAEQETERQKRNVAAMREQEDRERERVTRQKEKESEEVEEEEPTVSIGKKRRKKLVEKTTMDEHGYMHTETQVVWEEVEDIAPLKPKNKKAAKSTKGMKQGNLMGFFKKK